jgi:ATP-dependent RNA helicase RhlE
LSVDVLRAVGDLGYTEPTPVQERTIPAVLEGKDVLAAAQTGTGKTAAFLLPVLSGLGHATAASAPLMLVVTPTRELAQQIADVAGAICAHTGHRFASVVGGVGYEPQKKALTQGCDVLVATPGRLIDLMEQGACDLGGIDVLVLDEADRMLDMGFMPSVRRIVEACPGRSQTLLFSATLSADVLDNMGSLVTDPVSVEVAPKGTTAETVDQYVLGVSAEAKKRVLVELLRREGADRVIVFVRGKHRADHMSRVLQKKGFVSAPIHGDRSQNQRARALAQFLSGEVGVLVATDVLSRGIDIPEVSYVVNVDVPHEPEDYVHRIGRTGRAGARGWSLTFCSEDEYDDLRAIEMLTAHVMPTYPRAEGLDVGEDSFAPDPSREVPAAAPKKKRHARSRNRKRARG